MKSKSHYFGAIAQLGERLPCKQEVSGSIPLGSTIHHFETEISLKFRLEMRLRVMIRYFLPLKSVD
jgi:hypothetical protein